MQDNKKEIILKRLKDIQEKLQDEEGSVSFIDELIIDLEGKQLEVDKG